VISLAAPARPEARSKFLYLGEEKLYVRGVTYGTFEPDENGDAFPVRWRVDHDFGQMAAHGINALRTYTPPPRWLLDIAERHGLLVLAGFAWEQHVMFLADSERPVDVERRLRAAVRRCAGHPALLAWTIGNEIPAPIVRWYGPRRIERFLRRLYCAAKDEDPGGLVTYVSYPPTEYLDLPFLDFACFNVYLEERERLEVYLARLHNLTGERPLIMAEIGLDSRRNGEDLQAEVLTWQIKTSFEAGAAGSFIFAWTDEWYITHLDESGRGQGGSSIEDWDFGLTDRERRAKPALEAVRTAYAQVPMPMGDDRPRVSVVICSYNGERTIADALAGVRVLNYPDFELIVVDDGSTDRTAAIARSYGARVISTANQGLSSARNTGMREATGDIIAYTDDDARPDPDWLLYAVAVLNKGGYAAVGGPNVPPPGSGLVSDCVAAAPGGPAHVLLSDRDAEHIPGCNSIFRRDALMSVGGFDPRFRVAGDDVDACWRVQEAGGSIGFAPTALVWHHPRPTIGQYLRQQKGYGKAEAMLERKWPERYNATGHLSWQGRLYGRGLLPALRRRSRVYHGTWGSGLFQSLYDPPPTTLNQLVQLPEWGLVIVLLGGLGLLGAVWSPMLVFVPLVLLAFAGVVVQSARAARRARFPTSYQGLPEARARMLTALLYVLQPTVRLRGRLAHGLTPWRCYGSFRIGRPWPCERSVWSTRWRPCEAWLGELERGVRSLGALAVRGGDFDRWDLEVRGGLLGGSRLFCAIEEHGAGRQMVRYRFVPRVSALGRAAVLLFAALAVVAVVDSAWAAAAVLGACAAAVVVQLARECGRACGAAVGALASSSSGQVAETSAGDRDQPTERSRE